MNAGEPLQRDLQPGRVCLVGSELRTLSRIYPKYKVSTGLSVDIDRDNHYAEQQALEAQAGE